MANPRRGVDSFSWGGFSGFHTRQIRDPGREAEKNPQHFGATLKMSITSGSDLSPAESADPVPPFDNISSWPVLSSVAVWIELRLLRWFSVLPPFLDVGLRAAKEPPRSSTSHRHYPNCPLFRPLTRDHFIFTHTCIFGYCFNLRLAVIATVEGGTGNSAIFFAKQTRWPIGSHYFQQLTEDDNQQFSTVRASRTG